VCCCVLQCVAVCCRVLQSVAECCRVLQCVAVCCSVLQCIAVCCSLLQYVAVYCSLLQLLQSDSSARPLPHMLHDTSAPSPATLPIPVTQLILKCDVTQAFQNLRRLIPVIRSASCAPSPTTLNVPPPRCHRPRRTHPSRQ